MKTFENKTAVITGAGSGLGRSFALQLYTRGCRLALCDIDLDGLEETQSLTGDSEDRVSLHKVDVSDRQQMTAFAEDVLTQHETVDILINNAGISLTPQTFEQTSAEQFDKVVAINFGSVYNGILVFLPHLRTRPEASIINISSTAGLVGLYSYSAYSATKSAVRGLSEALQSELAGSNVSLLLVHPGGVKTNIIKNAPNLPDDQRESAHELFTRSALLDPDKAVQKILRAAEKKQNRLILGMDARLIFAIRKIFPRKFPSIFQAIFSQAMFGETVEPEQENRQQQEEAS